MAKKKIQNQQKLIIVLVLILFFVAGIGLSVWFKNSSFKSSTGESKTLPKTASLKLTTENKRVNVNESFTVKLTLDSGDQGVEAADFIVTFDPQYLQVRSLNSGTYFKTYPVKKTELNSIKISGVAYFDGQSIIVPKGKADVASMEFTAIAKSSSSKIAIDREKTVVASDGQNILNLNKINDLTISIR